MVAGAAQPARQKEENEVLRTLTSGYLGVRRPAIAARHRRYRHGPTGLLGWGLQHPHPNWNNKPAPGWGAASDNYALGAVHRVSLYRGFFHGMHENDDVSIMNRAATEDLRTVAVWPIIRRMLGGGRVPSRLAVQAVALIDRWRAQGASRLDRNLDGDIDAPGAAVMDAAWNGIAQAVMRPVLGPLTANLAQLIPTSSTPVV